MKDIDLLEISGSIAYKKNVKKNDKLTVNESNYIVVNIYNSKEGNGLQAMTLLNIKTKEYVIAYQGTDFEDINDVITDASLVSGNTPLQFEDAKKYFEKMNKRYGVNYVCGNSLGGGLANYVAIHHEDVKSVTYNPAILPTSVTTNKVYKNIKNYVGAYDPLTILEIAAGYENGIPGEVIITRDNIPALAFLATNHVGYTQYNEITVKGGNIAIRVDLLNGLPTSVFTNELLNYNYKGSGKKIVVNMESMKALKNGIDRICANVLYAQKYLDETQRIIQDEGCHLYDRIATLENENEEVFKCFGLDVVKVVDTLEQELNNMNPVIKTLYSIVEKINSVPIISEVFGYIVARNPITNLLTLVPEILKAAGDVLDSYSRIKRVGIPALLKDSDKLLDDGLPEKLKKHAEVISENKNIMMNRLTTYAIQTTNIWEIMSNADHARFDPKQIAVTVIPQMNTEKLVENKQFENIIAEKNKQLEENFTEFSKRMQNELSETIRVLHQLLFRFQSGIQDVQGFVQNIEGIAKYADIPIVSWDDGFFIDIYYTIRDARKELDKYVHSIDGITEIMRVASGRLNEIIIAMKPYIKNAIFNDTKYQNVIIYNLAAYNIYESSSVSFKEIEYQLSENEAESIQLLSMNAAMLKSDMKFLMNQIKKGTVC